MGTLLKKLQYKNQENILVMNVPDDAAPIMEEFGNTGPVKQKPGKSDIFGFILVFSKTTQDVSKYTGMISTHIGEDALLWFAYPKKTSKKYVSDITRDDGWNLLNALGYMQVRQISILEDWSAIRFRHIKYAKKTPRPKVSAV